MKAPRRDDGPVSTGTPPPDIGNRRNTLITERDEGARSSQGCWEPLREYCESDPAPTLESSAHSLTPLSGGRHHLTKWNPGRSWFAGTAMELVHSGTAALVAVSSLSS